MSPVCLSFSPYLKKNSTDGEYKTWIRANYPIKKIVLYPNGCVEVLRRSKIKKQPTEIRRSKITKMSEKSLRRLMFAANRSTCEFGSMLTLTYPRIFPTTGTIVKRDLNAVLQKLRQWDLMYLWFLEFQKRGAPHVHILIDTNYISPRMRASFAMTWTGRIARASWFNTRVREDDFHSEVMKVLSVNLHPKAWELIRSENGARNYVMKYAAKMAQKRVPEDYQDVGRFWGVSRKALPPADDYVEITEKHLIEWLEQQGHPAYAWDTIPRFLWGLEEKTNERPSETMLAIAG